LVGGANRLTLAEIAAWLAEAEGVRVHPATVHRALRRAGWT
jgi:transposase